MKVAQTKSIKRLKFNMGGFTMYLEDIPPKKANHGRNT